MKKKILITDRVHQILAEGLVKCGFVVKYDSLMSYDAVREAVKNFHGLIINSKVKCDKIFLDQARHLDFIGRLGSGLDIIDLEYANLLGVEIISSPEGNANAVGEHALGMLLGMLHNIGRAHQDVRSFFWNREPNRGEELKNKVIGIIGFGHTGPAFANKLKGFGVKVLVYDKYRRDIKDQYRDAEPVSLDTLLHQSDVVSIHLPLSGETLGLADRSFIFKMKKGAILMNTSRGQILDSAALKESLLSGHLQGACLDVLENEKPETWTSQERDIYTYLLGHEHVIITPHIAGWTNQSLKLIASILLEKIQKFYQL